MARWEGERVQAGMVNVSRRQDHKGRDSSTQDRRVNRHAPDGAPAAECRVDLPGNWADMVKRGGGSGKMGVFHRSRATRSWHSSATSRALATCSALSLLHPSWQIGPLLTSSPRQ